MNLEVIANIFAILYVPTIGFAVKGFIQYVTNEDGPKKRRGKLSLLLGGIGTAIVTILLFTVIWIMCIKGDNNDNSHLYPLLPSEPSNEPSSELPSEPADSIFRKNMVCSGGTYTGFVDQVHKEPNGTGTMEYFNGDRYNGEWENGQCHGDGEMAYANGDMYSGEWKCGEKNGYGVYTWSDGRVYKGNYKNDLRDGEGEYHGWTGFTTERGGWTGTYYGTSVDDIFEGDGIFEFDNGDRFDGTFHNNEFWIGTFTYHDGTQDKIDKGLFN